jgi:hypothetical protein
VKLQGPSIVRGGEETRGGVFAVKLTKSELNEWLVRFEGFEIELGITYS